MENAPLREALGVFLADWRIALKEAEKESCGSELLRKQSRMGCL
jgi:hypothetical protein